MMHRKRKHLDCEFAAASIKAGILCNSRERWSYTIVGSSILILPLSWLAVLCLDFNSDLNWMNLSILSILTVCIICAAYSLSKETALTELHTGLSAAANQRLILAVFEKLYKGKAYQSNEFISCAYFQGDLIHTEILTVLPTDNSIFLNVMHYAKLRVRLPFAFGVNTNLLQEAVAALKKELPSIAASN